MTTDFTYGRKQIVSGAPFKPSGKDMPVDARAVVKLYADIANIPNPHVGLKITVKSDETNNNKMTDYIVKSLKANASGIANSVVDQVQRYVDYLGVSSSGGNVSSETTLITFDNLDDNLKEFIKSISIETYVENTLISISATYNQGDNKIYPSTNLNSLKSNLVVTATYDDNTTSTVTDYTLSGTLSQGNSTITVNYAGKTSTFNVVVSPEKALDSISAVYTQGSTTVYPSTSLNSLKSNLVVKAI